MRDFLKDTNDAWEQQFGKEICEKFPRYAEFWSKYLGYRKDNPLKHYEIDSSRTGIADFDRKYEQMAFLHYGVFLDLSGIRIDIGRLFVNKYAAVRETLEYWADVKNVYSKMGNSIYKYETFLDYSKDVLNIGKITDPIFEKLRSDLDVIKNKRDFMVHFADFPFFYDVKNQAKKIPVRIRDVAGRWLAFSEILKQPRDEWVSAEGQIHTDLKEIESKFNDSHEEVLKLFDKYKRFDVIDPGDSKGFYGYSSGSSCTGGYSGFPQLPPGVIGTSGCPTQ